MQLSGEGDGVIRLCAFVHVGDCVHSVKGSVYACMLEVGNVCLLFSK